MLPHLNRLFNAVIVAAAIGAGASMAWRLYFPGAGEPSPIETVSLSIPAGAATHVRGSARLALVEFSDFDCTYCGRHARTVAHDIETQLVEPGRVRHVFFNFPLPNHPRALKASEAAACAARQGRFWEMHDRLFETSANLEPDGLVQHAGRLAVDTARFNQCLAGGEARAEVMREVKTGRRLGIRSTPSFYLGTVEPDGAITITKRIVGAVAFVHFRAAVDSLEPQRSASR